MNDESPLMESTAVFAGCLDDSPDLGPAWTSGSWHDRNDSWAPPSLPPDCQDNVSGDVLSRMQALLEEYRNRINRLEQRLHMHPRTGLPNLNRLWQDLDCMLENDPAGRGSLSVCILRLDSNFHVISKTFKPSISDWILYQTGMRLEELLMAGEQAYHTRDDEFVLLLHRSGNLHALEMRVHSFLGNVQKPHILAGRHLLVKARAGISRHPDHGLHRPALLQAAELALDKAIAEDRPFCHFEDGIRQHALLRMDMHASILSALEANTSTDPGNQFTLAWQPVVWMEPDGEGGFRTRAMDAEVLLRWNHPRKGCISPEEFIPFSEESGLILPIGSWVMYRVLEQLRAWQGTPMEDVCVSVNISPKQFMSDNFMHNLARELKATPGLRRQLKLEITEGCLLEDPESSIQRMRILHDLGLRFSLDDFGKGYSSLSYLSRLPLDTLKLDRQFIDDTADTPSGQAIIMAVLLLASRMDLRLVCEGVETDTQLHRLLEDGARGFQGYRFSPPTDRAAFEELHRRWRSGEEWMAGTS